MVQRNICLNSSFPGELKSRRYPQQGDNVNQVVLQER